MKRSTYVFTGLIVLISLILISCNTQVEETEEPVIIENTIKSVSFFQDTLGLDPQVLLESFMALNAAIDEIGYPDAGYEIWLAQTEKSDVRFLVEGKWPNQEIYIEIHDHQIYKDAVERLFPVDGMLRLGYNRFIKIKKQ